MAEAYTEEKRIHALETLERNNFNFGKTAREVGVAKQTLKKWYKDSDSIKSDEEEPENIDAGLVKETLLKQIYKLAKGTKDVEKAAKALNIVCQLYPENIDTKGQNIYDVIRNAISEKKQ